MRPSLLKTIQTIRPPTLLQSHPHIRPPAPLTIYTRQLHTSTPLPAPPAGQTKRPELPSDSERTSASPKSKDEKILDRAMEAEKDKAPITEDEEARKGLDRKEGIGSDEGDKEK
ncbi:hypothetical protein ABW19_dt0209714 [Dactylella cylindrospora]|nr:hypothetical protein ABW19_dt0209714 [Dactylella cylindrospora]